MSGITDFSGGSSDGREALKVMTVEYREESDGHRLTEPIIELYCRDGSGGRRLIEVEGFYPYFYIPESEYRQHEDELMSENVVRSIEARESVVSDEYEYNNVVETTKGAPRRTLRGRNLVRIYTVIPEHVGDLREEFNETFEADVFFNNRFLITEGIKTGVLVPRGEDRVHVDDIDPAGDRTPSVRPRVLTIDIEVWSGDEFPNTEETQKPITCVTVHDNFDDEYFAGILRPWKDDNTWPDDPTWELPDGVDDSQITIEEFEDEAKMLGHVNSWIIDKNPDLMTGWNSSSNDIGSGFDYPYWINRCYEVNEWSVEDIATDGTTFTTNSGRAIVGGREMFDMLQAYKKTQIHEKRSYSLEYIVNEELGYGKEDIDDLDQGWLHEPANFLKYNIRDVEAVVGIEDSKSVLDMYDHIRRISGASYSEIADSNIGIIDMLYLRRADDEGTALPTSTRPDMQHYWGAYVFEPEAGRHTNVVYPDLSSLYPNLFRDMNASPETIVGFADDLASSEYDEEDCHEIYVDPRTEQEKRDADEPVRKSLYVLKPEVKESFVRETIQDLIDMKYEYKSDEYSDEAYEAVKRITNSVYGCMGDSVSYGVGFRLFDWRIAEAITLAGRDVIKHTASEFESYVQDNGYTDAHIIAGDTDSCVCTIPTATSMDEALDVSFEGAEYVNSTYDDYMFNRFNIEDGNMKVEIESYAQAALFMDKKKRYAQRIRWDEGEEVDEIEVKGFELVRSDSAEITEEAQQRVIDLILKEDDPKPKVREYLREKWTEMLDGVIPLDEIGVPSKVNDAPEEYGGPNKNGNYYTPQPHIRGAKYATAHIDGEDIRSGDKPLLYYVDRVGYPYPDVYVYQEDWERGEDDIPNDPQVKELGREMDALALNDASNFPDEIQVDYEEMARRTLRDPIEPIIETMGWTWDGMTSESQQSGLGSFM